MMGRFYNAIFSETHVLAREFPDSSSPRMSPQGQATALPMDGFHVIKSIRKFAHYPRVVNNIQYALKAKICMLVLFFFLVRSSGPMTVYGRAMHSAAGAAQKGDCRGWLGVVWSLDGRGRVGGLDHLQTEQGCFHG